MKNFIIILLISCFALPSYSQLLSGAYRKKMQEQKTRTVDCGACGGTGAVACYGCMGTGVTTTSYMDANGYFWPVQVRCQYCGGGGAVRCAGCQGTGSIKIVIPQNNTNSGHTRGNYSGGGSYNNGTTSTRSSSTRRTCPGCNGEGRGADQITYSPDYTGKGNTQYCSTCGRSTSAHTHHRPLCRTCNGRGYVE